MRRVADILKDLGFNKEAPKTTQEAFVRNLIRAANGLSPEPPPPQNVVAEQLSFDSEILGTSRVAHPRKANSR